MIEIPDISLLIIIASLLIAIGVLIGGAIVVISRLKFQLQKLKLDRSTYQPRGQLLNGTEQHLHNLLIDWTQDMPVFVFAQVDLAAMITPTNKAVDFYEALEDLDNSIDFVIVDKDTTKPRLAIEYDGPTHERTNRKIRDAFLDKLFSDCQIPFMHVRSSDLANKEKLRDQVIGELEQVKS